MMTPTDVDKLIETSLKIAAIQSAWIHYQMGVLDYQKRDDIFVMIVERAATMLGLPMSEIDTDQPNCPGDRALEALRAEYEPVFTRNTMLDTIVLIKSNQEATEY